MARQRNDALRSESDVSTTSHEVLGKGSTLVLKPRADVTRIPEQRKPVTPVKGLCPSIFFTQKT